MIKGLVKSRLALALTLALGASSVAFADDTTSSMRGTITGPSGQPAANTKITLMHQPTGTVTEVTTNENGSFSATGLRVGGPYLVVIDSDTFQDTTKEDIFLQLGQTFRLNEQLKTAGDDTETLTVYGAAIASNKGSSSLFGAEDIQDTPTFNRDLKEVARMNPYANLLPGSDAPMSFAGSNPRYNSITIDGVGVNDDFGLNSNGYPTQRSPISIDAIDQVAVEVAPFDASEGGYTGGRINAVTKSGTNEFHGSLAYEKMSDSWAGTPKDPNSGEDIPLDFKRDTYSLTLGGPLIKDKLFFFTSYEKSKEPVQVEWGPATSGAANESNVTEEDYQRIKQIAQDVYGVDIGTWNSAPDTENENLLVKLDWNINSDHRMALTYNRTEGNVVRNQSNGPYTLQLDTNWYDYQQNMDLYTLQLYSDWSSDFSSELYLNYKKVDSVSGLKTKAFGDIDVDIDSSATLNFGPDYNRHANELNNKTWKLGAKFNYLVGDHQLKFGGEYEKLDVFNIFVRNSLGSWSFDSIEDFQNRKASSFYYENAYTNNATDAAADFSLGTANAYIQDNWYINDAFELGLGLRYERYMVSDKPTFNQNFYDRYGFSNQENLDGLDIWLPRVDLTWFANDDVTVHGGFGRFSGGRPNVWISNSFSNDGYTLVQFDRGNLTPDQYLDNVDITKVPDAVKAEMYAGDGSTNVIDPNFKLPSDWIARLGVDYRFDIPSVGNDFYWTTEVMRKWMTDNTQWKDISRCVSGQTSAGVNIYAPCNSDAPNGHYDLMLTNESKDGKAWIFTTTLQKEWDSGVSLYAAYTHQDIDEGNPGTSSTATSNYQYNIVKDRNVEEIGTADYEIEHSFKLSLGYRHEFIDGYASKFNLFFQRRSGTHYSYVWRQNRRGDYGDQSTFNNGSAYLPYIPTGANDPNISPESSMTYDQIMDVVNQAGLAGYAGGFAPKGVGTGPWVSTLDFQFQQEIPGFVEGHKGIFYFTINNLANLLNDDWGQVKRQNYTNKSLFNFEGLDAEGRYKYGALTSLDTKNWDTFEAEESTWRMKVGVKYTF
ncbi:TonB-dependent receptor [Gallaecimonas xiamenensis]|uniref:OmpA family Oar-like outer membrane protein n=1 Tax=Gallaecimonas xiamenensis 3-C-1 TaxID=745411 RepID=K2IQA6_9GAMM|nr:TonB-dependent receptor [Gallaecimonas xiamenensis]EKE72356.1 OmpA family Oar-like outer membrane protein [Gallaecimonas xiamenensis 3-C-1]